MDDLSTRGAWRIETLETPTCPGHRWAALAAIDPAGGTAAVADLCGPATADWVELSLQFGPERPPTDVVGELVRAGARLAADAGAARLIVILGHGHRVGRDMVTASGLDFRVVTHGDAARAELTLASSFRPAHRRRPGHHRRVRVVADREA
jgi:hypothetical protein